MKEDFLHVHFQRSFIRSRYHGNSTFGEIFLNNLKKYSRLDELCEYVITQYN